MGAGAGVGTAAAVDSEEEASLVLPSGGFSGWEGVLESTTTTTTQARGGGRRVMPPAYPPDAGLTSLCGDLLSHWGDW